MARIDVLTEVTGSVWKTQILPGAEVGADDVIMIIESMKMEIPVFSPSSGRLIEVLVKEGESVEEGQVVAVIEA